MAMVEPALLCKVGATLTLGLAFFLVVASAILGTDTAPRRLWDDYAELLDRRLRTLSYTVSGTQLALGQLALLALLALVHLLLDVPYWYVLALLILFAPIAQLEQKRRQRVAELERQLDAFMLALASALKSIPSVSLAFQSLAETAAPPMREELELCNREMRVGSTLDEVLAHLCARVGSPRLDSALSAVVLGRRIGGNLPRILESTAGSIREMFRLEGVLRTKTSEAKMQLYVIGAAPVFLTITLSLMSPGYFDPLQASSTGYVVGMAALSCWLLAIYLARKVLSVSL